MRPLQGRDPVIQDQQLDIISAYMLPKNTWGLFDSIHDLGSKSAVPWNQQHSTS